VFKIMTCFLLAVSMTACTSKNKNSEAQDLNTLFVAIGSKPSTLDPRISTDANGMRISALIFNSLVKVGPNLEIIGDAAESWSYNNLVYSFKLQPNIKFSNGRALTAEDIKYTFSEYKSSKSPFHSAFKDIQTVNVTNVDGQLVVKIKLRKFSAKFITSDLPVVKILPKAEATAAGDEFYKNPIGTSSYALSEASENQIILSKVKTHTVNPAKTQRIVFKIIRDDFTRYQKMLKGNIDIAQSEIPPSKVKDFERRSSDFSVHKYSGLATSYILINLKDKDLQKLKLRQAIAKAINRKEIIDYKLEGLAQLATSIITPASPFFNNELQPIAYEPQKAKKLLEALHFNKEITLKTSNSQEAVDNAKVIANQLQKIGLKVKLQSFEWGTFYSDVKKGNFQLATMRWIGVNDPDIYRIAFHSHETPPGRNRGYYTNKTIDLMTEKGLSIPDQAKRVKYYYKVQDIILKDLPIIPLWYNQQVSVVRKSIKHYEPWKNGSFSSFISVTKEAP